MSKFKNKRVLIVGFGLSGVAAAKYLVKQGAKVMVSDQKQRQDLMDSFKACADLKIEYDLGRVNPKLLEAAELVVVSPGVPLSNPMIQEAQARKIPITSELEIAAGLLKEPLVAITGTNGKTTTTTLVGEMFKADQKHALVGGNIGTPLLDLVGHREGQADVAVAEVSSFQLELAQKMVPAVAVFTNIDQDHLDRYGSMDAYVEAKKNLLRLSDKNSFVVLNYDDPVVQRFSNEATGKVIWFTKQDPLKVGGTFSEKFVGAYLRDGGTKLVAKFSSKEEVYDLSKLRLFGDHNKENLMAAVCSARVLGVSAKSIQKVIDQFEGVSHRLEFVRKKDGVYFFNDSKATNAQSVIRSLQSFKRSPVILIAGGRDKDIDYSVLTPHVRGKVKILILLGEAKEKINRAIGDAVETYLVGTFEEAVLLAYQKSRSGDIILLSPACASFDMFRNYEERGDYFKKLVQQL